MARDTSRRGLTVVSAIGITALAVGVIALSALAIQRASPPASTATAAPVPTYDVADSPSATPSTSSTADAVPRGAERFLTVGANAMWRGVAGVCDQTPPVIERSGDNGESWQDVTPTYRGIAQVRALTSFGGANATTVIDTEDDCATSALTTFSDGEFWELYDDMFAAASFLPANPGAAVIDGQSVAAPCAAPSGLRVNGSAALLCDGTAFARADDAWVPLTPGAVAVAADAEGVVAAHSSTNCDGLQLTRYDGDAPIDLGCAPNITPDEPLAIDLDDSDVVIWAGDELTRITG